MAEDEPRVPDGEDAPGQPDAGFLQRVAEAVGDLWSEEPPVEHDTREVG